MEWNRRIHRKLHSLAPLPFCIPCSSIKPLFSLSIISLKRMIRSTQRHISEKSQKLLCENVSNIFVLFIDFIKGRDLFLGHCCCSLLLNNPKLKYIYFHFEGAWLKMCFGKINFESKTLLMGVFSYNDGIETNIFLGFDIKYFYKYVKAFLKCK